MFRVLVIIGAIPLVVFFAWPWLSRVVVDPAMEQQISVQAGGVTTTFPMVLGLFGTLGLVAMLMAVKR
jgi:quinol-cytochrome oxidoreductase complex cytochrome b subunit